MNDLKICAYNSTYNQSFYELNKAWIEEFWELEKSDLKIYFIQKMPSLIKVVRSFCSQTKYSNWNSCHDSISRK